MDNKLFSIEPKKGRLSPGESCTVTLSYKHTMVGTDRLPVVFKLSRGREILVYLHHLLSTFLHFHCTLWTRLVYAGPASLYVIK